MRSTVSPTKSPGYEKSLDSAFGESDRLKIATYEHIHFMRRVFHNIYSNCVLSLVNSTESRGVEWTINLDEAFVQEDEAFINVIRIGDAIKQIDSMINYPATTKEDKTLVSGKYAKEKREENLRFYNQYKTELYKKYAGKYLVIARGKIETVGESFDDVKNVALDASHRFIFKVEPKKKIRGTLRWPMKRK